jgi:hypothetical protein
MSRGNFLIITPERLADHLERLVNDPAELREQVEAQVLAQLRDAEISARMGAVVLRRIRDKQLYVPSGWPSWHDFCAYFSPQEPERIDIFIRALEVLESRGEKRDFGEEEAKRLAAAETMANTEAAVRNLSAAEYGAMGGRGKKAVADGNGFKPPVGSNSTSYLAARLKRDHPDIAAAVERGEYRSMRAAAREAGIIKPPNPYRQLIRWWGRASDHDRMRFEDFIEQWHREDEEVA